MEIKKELNLFFRETLKRCKKENRNDYTLFLNMYNDGIEAVTESEKLLETTSNLNVQIALKSVRKNIFQELKVLEKSLKERGMI